MKFLHLDVPAWAIEQFGEARVRTEIQAARGSGLEAKLLRVIESGRSTDRDLGSVLAYAFGITTKAPEFDATFYDPSLPDIDADFNDQKRDTCYQYLNEKYGNDRVARVGTISTYKPKSALIETCKALGISPFESIAIKNALITRMAGDARASKCLIDTFENTDAGRAFVKKHPSAAMAGDLEGHASHTGVHAAGVCVSNEPIDNFCTVVEGIMQLTKNDAEYLNLLKIDVLGLRTLGVIEDAGVVEPDELYNVPIDDPKVFALFNAHKHAAVFQWEGAALQKVSNQINITKFDDLSHITALARPGPLAGGAATHYIERHAGREKWSYPHPAMAEFLDETLGLVVYQEQVLRVCREIAGLSWKDATKLQKAMGKSLGAEIFEAFREKFFAGAAATHGIDADTAKHMWDEINGFGSYAFNKSHSVSYAAVSYWTAWMKTYHPLEYAAAALRNSQDDAAVLTLLRELNREGVQYVAFDPDLSEINWSVKNGRLVGGYQNLHGVGPAKAVAYIEKRRLGILTDKDKERIANSRIKFQNLYPLHSDYPEYFELNSPKIDGQINEIGNLPNSGEVLLLVQVVAVEKKDDNDQMRLERRNGRRVQGNSLFADVSVVDDSSANPITLRIPRQYWDPVGRVLVEKLQPGKDVLLARGEKIDGWPIVRMISKITRYGDQIPKLRCLTQPDLFAEPRYAPD